MAKFSVFSIYETEMRIFINALKEQSTIDIEKITSWLYETGMNVFQKSQAALHYPYVEECQKKFNHNPSISYYHALGQQYHGFTAIKEALLQSFSENEPEFREVISNNFDKILLTAPAAHNKFITIESQIASTFNDFIDKNGPLTRVESLEKIITLFEIEQTEHTDLQEDFKNKLTVMREALAEMKKTVNPMQAPNEFFKTQPKKTEQIPVPASINNPIN